MALEKDGQEKGLPNRENYIVKSKAELGQETLILGWFEDVAQGRGASRYLFWIMLPAA